MSITGGLEQALIRGHALRCRAIQMFTKSSGRWRERYLKRDEIALFRATRESLNINPVISHAGYLINLAAPDDQIYEKSCSAMIEELTRCEQLGIDYLVVHPGHHRGLGEAFGIGKVAEALNRIMDVTRGSSVSVALETMAGQGTTLGGTFEELAAIMEAVAENDRVALCLDLCHIFAAGYDIRSRAVYDGVFARIDNTIGLQKLKVIHVSDSKRECGSRVDRHEDIGKGMIGIEPFRWVMEDERLKYVPKILETPTDLENITILENLAR